MTENLPVQEVAFNADPVDPLGIIPEEPTKAITVDDEDERVYVVSVPGITSSRGNPKNIPDEITSVVDYIGALADRIGKATALTERFSVKRVLMARWSGETNMERLASCMGIRRQSLHRILARGEKNEHPAYEAFYAAFHQMYGATVLNSLEVVRSAAHSGNAKMAIEHLKLAAPDLVKAQSVESASPIQVNIDQRIVSLMNLPVDERISVGFEALNRMDIETRQKFIAMMPDNLRRQLMEMHGNDFTGTDGD
jgi:hypothetical protein